MKAYLAIDFGSTYTKLTAIDLDNEVILATAKDITTVEDDIMIGFNKAFNKLKIEINKKINFDEISFVNKTACSSAAGGLKMVAIGLVPELTAEAAKKAALGAGARVIKTYAYELNSRELEEIKNTALDIILLAGGTDGGNKECIIHNAKMLAEFKVKIPVVVAGNKAATDEIENILKEAEIDCYITENVMPFINKLNVEPSREEIRKVFMNKIVEAKGMKKAEEFIKGILMPTPAAVLKASEILATGTDEEEGLGDLIVVDIGGATTDIHSIAKGEPTKPSIMIKGLEEPYAKRTVEGDLGMRYSAIALLEASGTRKIRNYLHDSLKQIDVKAQCQFRHDNIKMVPQSEEEIRFDEVLKASEILATGTDEEEGLGDLIVVDIGGATTDIHSIAKGEPTKPSIMIKGLEEPYAKRTVEGDLGMRYSAIALLEASGTRKIRNYLHDSLKQIDVKAQCQFRHDNIKMVPQSEEEIRFDEAMAKAATELAMTRHCGVLECVYTPMGTMFNQSGKDLTETPYVIGTGGVIIHSLNPKDILKAGNFNEEDPIHLKPIAPKFLVDKTYILSSMGLLAQEYPNTAIRIMKKYLVEA